MILTYRLISFDHLKGIAKLIFVLLRSRYADVCRKTKLGEISGNRFLYCRQRGRVVEAPDS